MPLSNLDLKRVYYYVVCAIAFFILIWGSIDFVSSSIGLANLKGSETAITQTQVGPAGATDKNEQFFDSYYQKKMLSDRFWDSLVRLLISGIVFTYFRYTVNKLERQA